MANGDQSAPRPRRTREHVIASQSRNYIEKFILDKGHTASRPSDDYGYDLFVETYDQHGYVENGEICVQIRATDRLREMKRGDSVLLNIDFRHYELWTNEVMPVWLILYDAQEKRAFWIHVQHYFATNSARRPKPNAKTLRVCIPVSNEFTEETVDEMRARKAEVLAQDRQRGR